MPLGWGSLYFSDYYTDSRTVGRYSIGTISNHFDFENASKKEPHMQRLMIALVMLGGTLFNIICLHAR